MVVAVVPVKALADAKGRLAAALDARARAGLVGALLARVLAACAAAEAVGAVVVVAGDRRAAALAAGAGVRVVVERRPGLDAALRRGDLEARHASACLVVPADLPLVTGEDLDAVCGAGPDPVVVVAPSHDGGTGALLRRPPAVVPAAFGPGSARAHLRLAAARMVAARTIVRPGLALDIDTPEDLATWAAHEPAAAVWLAAGAPPTLTGHAR